MLQTNSKENCIHLFWNLRLKESESPSHTEKSEMVKLTITFLNYKNMLVGILALLHWNALLIVKININEVKRYTYASLFNDG